MKKTYKMFLALMLCMLGAVNVSAEIISLQDVPFCTWDGWGADAKNQGAAECLWVIGEGAGNVYGDTNVKNYADVSNYTRLIVTVSDGTPRFLLNRDVDEGQWADVEENSHLIDNTKGGWSAKYFSSEAGKNEGETVYYVDLKQLAKDKGYAHLHAIKGANWQNVTIVSMMIEQVAKAPIGWTSVITNGNFDGEDVSSFFVAEDAVNVPGVKPATIVEGAGVAESNGLAITSLAGATETWATQLFVKANEALPEGTKWRFSMDVKANAIAKITTGAHAEPRTWLAGGIIPEFDVTEEWATVTAEGTVDADLGGKSFQSIAFDLNNDKDNAVTFYFDNISFEVFKLGTVVEFGSFIINADFGFDTNIGDLAKATVEKRVFFPKSCVEVTVNGKKLTDEDILSIEGFEDGRFFIFLNDENDDLELTANSKVNVAFKNPTDAAYQVKYTSGSMNGEAVKDFDLEGTYNSDFEDLDVYAYVYKAPIIVAADPEEGSFNLPNSITDFKITLDKPTNCAKIEGYLNTEKLVANPAEGFATEITFKRTSTGDLPTGEYSLHFTKMFGEKEFADDDFGDSIFVVNIGKVEPNPDDVEKTIIPLEYFTECAVGSIPEGYVLYADGETPEERLPGMNYGSGARMMEFAAGGDFTRGLYMRTWYLEYGATTGHEISLEGGKTYTVTFNSCRWAGAGQYMNFQVLTTEGEEIFSQVIDNGITLNEKRDAVNGSTYTKIKFAPEKDGQYLMRWVVAKNAQGEPTENAWQNGVILANVLVKYIPNTVGLEYIQMLTKALDDAKVTIDGNADERYNGADIDALKIAYEKHFANKDIYTAPSVFIAATEELNALNEAMKAHRQLCDNYDTNIKKSIDVQRQNEMPDGDPTKATKFTKTELFAELVAMNAKYHGASEWKNVADTISDPQAEPIWQLFYTYDVLKDNDALTVAVKELSEIATTTSLLFTEGESTCSSTGTKVLVERIRLGVEDLKALGVAADDELIAWANNALTDDDEIVEAIKNRIKLVLYDSLQANGLFTPVVDNETLEETTPTYDMTVFAKNPNVYKLSDKTDFTDEAVSGWVVPEGFSRPGLSCGWGAFQGTSVIAEDCMFQTWGGSYRVEQTITDLPAGVYNVVIGFGERVGDDASNMAESFIYAKTSETPAVEDGGIEDRALNFAATADCQNIGQSYPKANTTIEGVVVTDGFLTFGANASQGSHTFFNDVRIVLTAPAAGFDYKKAYEDAEAGVETVANTATVRAIELYDLNGRRVLVAPRGIAIVKKYMNDGTVRMEKVIRK
jgi:hypothetical protein